MLANIFNPLKCKLSYYKAFVRCNSGATNEKMRRFETQSKFKTPTNFIERELHYGAHNYKPLPVVISRGKGVY